MFRALWQMFPIQCRITEVAYLLVLAKCATLEGKNATFCQLHTLHGLPRFYVYIVVRIRMYLDVRESPHGICIVIPRRLCACIGMLFPTNDWSCCVVLNENLLV